jgi:hypothetical protein
VIAVGFEDATFDDGQVIRLSCLPWHAQPNVGRWLSACLCNNSVPDTLTSFITMTIIKAPCALGTLPASEPDTACKQNSNSYHWPLIPPLAPLSICLHLLEEAAARPRNEHGHVESFIIVATAPSAGMPFLS